MIFPSDKRVFAFTILVIFLVFGFNTWTVDRSIYEGRYNYWDEDFFLENTEPIYSFYIKSLNGLGISFQGFIIISALLFVSVLAFYTQKTTKNFNFALGLYLIAAFMFEVSMLRNTFAFCFMIPAFYFLIYEKSYTKYVVLTSLACLCHISSVIFFLYLLCYVKTKTLLKFVALGCLFLFPITYIIKQYILEIAPLLGMEQKADIVFDDMDNGGNLIVVFLLSSFRVLSIVLLCIGTLFILYKYKLATKFPVQVFNINLLSLLILPILLVSHDSFRPMFVICLVNVCAMSVYNYTKVYKFLLLASFNVAYWIYIRPYFVNIFVKPLCENVIW